jgi:heme/copper-type cytochrome/quinol oxidase subunit 2
MIKQYFKSFLLALIAHGCIIAAHAQDAAANVSTDVMRSNGKIYVVMAVVVTIVTGLFAYVYSIDKKISKLENK